MPGGCPELLQLEEHVLNFVGRNSFGKLGARVIKKHCKERRASSQRYNQQTFNTAVTHTQTESRTVVLSLVSKRFKTKPTGCFLTNSCQQTREHSIHQRHPGVVGYIDDPFGKKGIDTKRKRIAQHLRKNKCEHAHQNHPPRNLEKTNHQKSQQNWKADHHDY